MLCFPQCVLHTSNIPFSTYITTAEVVRSLTLSQQTWSCSLKRIQALYSMLTTLLHSESVSTCEARPLKACIERLVPACLESHRRILIWDPLLRDGDAGPSTVASLTVLTAPCIPCNQTPTSLIRKAQIQRRLESPLPQGWRSGLLRRVPPFPAGPGGLSAHWCSCSLPWVWASGQSLQLQSLRQTPERPWLTLQPIRRCSTSKL